MAFDLLIADRIDLRPLPLEQRKARLARIGVKRPVIRGVTVEVEFLTPPLDNRLKRALLNGKDVLTARYRRKSSGSSTPVISGHLR